MMDATVSLSAIFWLCAGLASIWGVYKIIKRPFNQLDDHEYRIKRLEKSTEERKGTDTLILRSLNAMVNHMIDGEAIDKLKEVRDDLQNDIIEHHK